MRVRVSENAKASKAVMLDFIAEQHTSAVAEDIDNEILNMLEALGSLPWQGPVVATRHYGLLRKAVVNKRTIILYEVDVENDIVSIVDIVPARSDWK